MSDSSSESEEDSFVVPDEEVEELSGTEDEEGQSLGTDDSWSDDSDETTETSNKTIPVQRTTINLVNSPQKVSKPKKIVSPKKKPTKNKKEKLLVEKTKQQRLDGIKVINPV